MYLLNQLGYYHFLLQKDGQDLMYLIFIYNPHYVHNQKQEYLGRDRDYPFCSQSPSKSFPYNFQINLIKFIIILLKVNYKNFSYVISSIRRTADLLKKLKNKNVISEGVYNKLSPVGSKLETFYGSAKVYKPIKSNHHHSDSFFQRLISLFVIWQSFQFP